jgi:hypothetical protein
MRWFRHRHYWHAAESNDVINPDTGKAKGALIIEKCDCGAVRTIEFAPGVAPVVRYAKQEGNP